MAQKTSALAVQLGARCIVMNAASPEMLILMALNGRGTLIALSLGTNSLMNIEKKDYRELCLYSLLLSFLDLLFFALANPKRSANTSLLPSLNIPTLFAKRH